MTQAELNNIKIFDLYDMLVEVTQDLTFLENSPVNELVIREKRERVLILQNAIMLKKLEGLE